MTVTDHLHALYRLPAHTFPGPGGRTDDLPDPEAFAWRVTSDVYDADEDWTKAFARFCSAVDTTRVRALIVGAWQEAYDTDPSDVIEALVAARDRFPALRAVFLGDMVGEECEISWINQTDVTPLLAAYPALEEFGVRGGSGLRFPAVSHRALRSLVIETGGLPAEVVRGVGGSDLPALVHLDLWLGTPSTAATARSPTWSRSCPAPGCRACVTSPCATARSRTPWPQPSRPRPWWPGWRCWTSPWAC